MENIWIDFSLKTYIQMHRKRYSTLSNSEWDANTLLWCMRWLCTTVIRDVEKLEPSCIAGRNMKWHSWQFLKIFNVDLSNDPIILLLYIYPRFQNISTQNL